MNLLLSALIFNLAPTTLQATLNSKHCLQDKHGNEFCEDSMNPDSIHSVKPYDGLMPHDVITQNGGNSQDVLEVMRSRTEKNTKLLVLVSEKIYKNMLEKEIKKAIANYKKQALGDKKKLFFFVPFLLGTAVRIAARVLITRAVKEIIKQGAKAAIKQGTKEVIKKGAKQVINKGAKEIKKGAKEVIENGADVDVPVIVEDE